MKVLFDHQKFSTQYYGGISRYFATLIDHIRVLPEFQYDTGVLFSTNQYLRDRHPYLNNPLAESILTSGLGQKKVYDLNQQNCIRLLKNGQFDVFHPTYYDPYFLPHLSKKPLVITIHDMTYERMPEYFWAKDPLSHQKRLNVERADRIIAISEATKADLLDCLPATKPENVEVIYHGIDLDSPLSLAPVSELPARYILFVGDRSGYKNFYLVLEAFRHIARQDDQLRLVLAGGGRLEVAEHEAISRFGLHDKIIHRNASDAELNYMYQQAEFFLYPSLYEGFGLPILEAFRAGCPVLLSDTACFREIATEAADFFEPRSLESLVHQMKTLLHDTNRRKKLIEKGNKRLLDFPIQKCIDQTLNLYTSLA